MFYLIAKYSQIFRRTTLTKEVPIGTSFTFIKGTDVWQGYLLKIGIRGVLKTLLATFIIETINYTLI